MDSDPGASDVAVYQAAIHTEFPFYTAGDQPPTPPDEPIRYYLNVEAADMDPWVASHAVRAAFEAWNQEPSSWIYFEYMGLTSINPEQEEFDDNIVYFHEDQPGILCAGVRGLTLRRLDGSFNICLNASFLKSFDTVMHTTMHEAGHALGAGHYRFEGDYNVMESGGDRTTLGYGDRAFAHDWYDAPATLGTGDFNGDGWGDIVEFTNEVFAAPVWVALWQEEREVFEIPPEWNVNIPWAWHDFFAPKGETALVGNFNGDEYDDIVTFVGMDWGLVYVCLSNGRWFSDCALWKTDFSFGTSQPAVGDVNCDGKDDILTFERRDKGTVWVATSDGDGFGSNEIWHSFFGLSNEVVGVGDFDGDDCDDLVLMHNGAGLFDTSGVFVARSRFGSDGERAFGEIEQWHDDFCGPGGKPKVMQSEPVDMLYCLGHDGPDSTRTYPNEARDGFVDPEPVSGAPGFNHETLLVNGDLVWFQHGQGADVMIGTRKVLESFGPGPCPWPGGGCP